jgi:hypothetical protein
MKRILERLDFSFNDKDLQKIKELYFNYLKECFYNIGVEDYIDNYVLIPKNRDSFYNENLENLYLLKEFFNRKYEIFTVNDIKKIIDEIKENLIIEEVEDTQDFLLNEEKRINKLELLFNLFEEKLNETPKINLKEFNYDVYGNVLVYFLDNTDTFILKETMKFIDTMNKNFLPYLSELNKIIICDPEYLNYSAGDKCFAYYLEDDVFIPSYIEQDEKNFFVETIYHEFGHFVYYLLPNHLQCEWVKEYTKWDNKGLNFTRSSDEDMDLYELFADCFAVCYSSLHDSLSSPDKEVLDKFKEIIKKINF